ncbi:hypothetical protein FA10DRAFT_281008 [Acaromyces ingoldii]|uniref:Mur ligase n=1 Tax=Acaromyces ingoldii TaxID=215250 RepID=A0A316YL92_9BASI|nr:hypothetical protein FA10DRAFT_281008 [Acaromyces ingoldii]PWN88495.1 hypothetical protein FA10DRAFT_281008 [Acaromyces ingoldii]
MASATALPAKGGPQIHQSLDKVTALLKRLNDPQNTFPVIHVAGTNAKGSTIAYLDSVARHAVGLRTGTFTSPHLIEERDCCRINGQVVDSAVWQEAGERVAQADQGAGPAHQGSIGASPFEVLVARALLSFNIAEPETRPDLLLVEVGMGGLLDATNVFPSKQVLASVICPIDKDHQAMLGDSLSEIARHKAGIIKCNGLCVMADQRRGQASNEMDPLSVKLAAEEAAALRAQKDGQGPKATAEIVDTIRETCIGLQARLVRSHTPLQLLSSPSSSTSSSSPWSLQVHSPVRYSPTLSASRLKPGTFVARTGDPVVPGPDITHPGTRAAMTGAHLALQTLWSVARDEPPSAMEMAGTDANEDLRLRIAWALRDDRDAQAAVIQAVAATRWPGRCEWVDARVGHEAATAAAVQGESEGIDDTQENESGDEMQVDSEAIVDSQLHLLVDGAHNAASAAALRAYVDSCIRSRLVDSQQPAISAKKLVNITWLVAFSRGKEVKEMLSILFGPSTSLSQESQDTSLATGMQRISLQGSDGAGAGAGVQVRHRVACLEFSTPVEGMPWVSSLESGEVRQALGTLIEGEDYVREFGKDLAGALRWARDAGGDGKSITSNASDEQEASLVVLAGSLYLIGDMHRLILNNGSP